MGKTDTKSQKDQRAKALRWVATVFTATLIVSGSISLLSDSLLSASGTVTAFVILFSIVAVGILFDIIGVAVTAADERPFHSMASRKVPGAQEAIRLLRNAGQVSSVCNDVVGDICGVISGTASAAIAGRMISQFSFSWPRVISLLMSAMVAGMTVGGKALGKTVAIQSSTEIVYMVGKCLFRWNRFRTFFQKKRKR